MSPRYRTRLCRGDGKFRESRRPRCRVRRRRERRDSNDVVVSKITSRFRARYSLLFCPRSLCLVESEDEGSLIGGLAAVVRVKTAVD